MSKALSITDLVGRLEGKVAFTENLQVDAKPVVKVYEENLPENITMEVAQEVNNYNANFMSAYADVCGRSVVDLVKTNDAVEALEATVTCAGTEFGVFFSRPMGEDVDLEQCESAFGFGISVPINGDIESDVRKSLANAYFGEDEE